MTVNKELNFNWEYEYAEGQKAQLYDADGQPLSSKHMLNLSKSFDYWDISNECPPIHIGGEYSEADWQKGHIIWDTRVKTGSGMDFTRAGVGYGLVSFFSTFRVVIPAFSFTRL